MTQGLRICIMKQRYGCHQDRNSKSVVELIIESTGIVAVRLLPAGHLLPLVQG